MFGVVDEAAVDGFGDLALEEAAGLGAAVAGP
jgi:hypothetical protein